MSKQTKPPPKFKNGAQERAFWESTGRDSTEYLDWAKAAQSARVDRTGHPCSRPPAPTGAAQAQCVNLRWVAVP